jgi:predicted transcriptional regulator
MEMTVNGVDTDERAVASDGSQDHLALMADVVAAYVSNNSLPPTDLPALMRSVHMSLLTLGLGTTPVPVEEPKAPAVPIKKSITPDFLICLEDGKKFRSLKRHLGTVYNLTPEKYREKWGLPNDYPMVAPAYSAVRSKLAKAIGLGQTNRTEAVVEETPAKKARGRAKD